MQVAEGDERAFSELFHQYRNVVYTIAYKITTSEPMAEEILLDVFLKVWLKREQLVGIEHFTAWLFTITRNQVFSSLKQLAVRRKAEGCAGGEEYLLQPANPDHQLLEKEYQQLLHEAVLRLSPQQKRVYQLIKEQGMKREEAARALNLSPETVKRHLAEAMQLIRGYCLAKADLYAVLLIIRHLL